MKLIIPTLIFTGLYCIYGLILNPQQKLIPFLIGVFVASVIFFLAFYFIIRYRKKEMTKDAKLFNEKVLCFDLITYKKGILYNAGFCYLLENKFVFKTGIFRIQNPLSLPISDITTISTLRIGFNKTSIKISSKNQNPISFIVDSNSNLLIAIKQIIKVE